MLAPGLLQITEREFQAQVVELAHLLGWTVLHVRRSVGRRNGVAGWQTTTSVIGWVDLFMWKPGRVVAAELKREKGRLTDEQADVIRSLTAAGVPCEVWRPSDWPRIKEVLT